MQLQQLQGVHKVVVCALVGETPGKKNKKDGPCCFDHESAGSSDEKYLIRSIGPSVSLEGEVRRYTKQTRLGSR